MIVSVNGALWCGGCKRASHEVLIVQATEAEKFDKQVDSLYQKYLDGSLEEAERSLQEILHVVEGSNVEPRVQAHTRYLAYVRLYAMEVRRRGDTDPVAEAYLLEARYWFLQQRKFEGRGFEDASKDVQSLTPQQCKDFVEKWDKDHSGGKGPRFYWKEEFNG